jgi:hypothetical protein
MNTISKFHFGNGITFCRLDDGSVRVEGMQDKESVVIDPYS